jgi:hypothetical protein
LKRIYANPVMNMNNVVQLEAFESPLRGRRIRWFVSPGAPALYPPGFQEQCFTESPPFQKRYLITSPQSSEAWKLTDKWDAIFTPTTGIDWSLILTYLLNQPPSVLVLCTPEVQAPIPFFQKCTQAGHKAPTLICLQMLTLPLPQAPVTFDATFYPPAKAVDDHLMDAMQISLENLMSADRLRTFVVRDALRDLRGAGATLVISRIEDPDPCLYWYYASEPKARGKDLLASVVQTLLSRELTT